MSNQTYRDQKCPIVKKNNRTFKTVDGRKAYNFFR